MLQKLFEDTVDFALLILPALVVLATAVVALWWVRQ
jgi:hypothetical protein